MTGAEEYNMSKIPQGEWNAIAARYQNGESISKIARSYGCTPPAIHYILKRNRLRRAETAAQPALARSADATQTGLVRASATAPEKSINGVNGPVLVRTSVAGSAPSVQPAAPPVYATATTRPPAPANLPNLARESAPSSLPNPAREPASSAATPDSPLPGLDSELHLRAETAIEKFRSSFDAALSEGSPGVCERLRQAASDLMKVAARTTMVLDRLSAISERSARAHNYPRSAHASDDFGKLG
jgi:hypothetical protein